MYAGPGPGPGPWEVGAARALRVTSAAANAVGPGAARAVRAKPPAEGLVGGEGGVRGESQKNRNSTKTNTNEGEP